MFEAFRRAAEIRATTLRYHLGSGFRELAPWVDVDPWGLFFDPNGLLMNPPVPDHERFWSVIRLAEEREDIGSGDPEKYVEDVFQPGHRALDGFEFPYEWREPARRIFLELHVNILELDEQWSFLKKKAKHVKPGDAPEVGDCYLHVALDATTKAVVSYVVGKRSGEHTAALVNDLRARITNRPQITADGWPAYPGAIENAFGTEVDFATIVKDYTTTPGNEAAVRYSPGSIRSVEKTVVMGDPDTSAISTSYVERFNLTTGMHSRRFTRLTNAFSKTLANHRAAIALQMSFYNLCRWHETIRCTPAMAIGVADHVWSIGELVDAALSAVEPTPLVPAPRPVGMSVAKAKGDTSATTKQRLYVIKGGKGGRK